MTGTHDNPALVSVASDPLSQVKDGVPFTAYAITMGAGVVFCYDRHRLPPYLTTAPDQNGKTFDALVGAQFPDSVKKLVLSDKRYVWQFFPVSSQAADTYVLCHTEALYHELSNKMTIVERCLADNGATGTDTMPLGDVTADTVKAFWTLETGSANTVRFKNVSSENYLCVCNQEPFTPMRVLSLDDTRNHGDWTLRKLTNPSWTPITCPTLFVPKDDGDNDDGKKTPTTHNNLILWVSVGAAGLVLLIVVVVVVLQSRSSSDDGWSQSYYQAELPPGGAPAAVGAPSAVGVP